MIILLFANTLLHKLRCQVSSSGRNRIFRIENSILLKSKVLSLLFRLLNSLRWLISILIMPLKHLMLNHSTLRRNHLLLLPQNILSNLPLFLLLVGSGIDLLPLHLREYRDVSSVFYGLLAVFIEY